MSKLFEPIADIANQLRKNPKSIAAYQDPNQRANIADARRRIARIAFDII
jgi:hypothetical protein